MEKWKYKFESCLRHFFCRGSTTVSTGVSYASNGSSILSLGTRNHLCSLHDTSVHKTCKYLIEYTEERDIPKNCNEKFLVRYTQCYDGGQTSAMMSCKSSWRKKIYGVMEARLMVSGGRGSSPLYSTLSAVGVTSPVKYASMSLVLLERTRKNELVDNASAIWKLLAHLT